MDDSEKYEQLSKDIQMPFVFTSIELVKKDISSYTFIKNKYRTKVNASPDLRLYLATK